MTDNKPGLGDPCYKGHTWATYTPHSPAQCAKCGALKPDTKRYQIKPASQISDAHYVIDTWTKEGQGFYMTKAQAQARARTLNSRNGGK
jgi:hypothetical protein